MKTVRLTLIAIACSVPLLASAQWQWLDKDGRKVFSDQPPPAEIAPNRILKAPPGRALAAPATQADAPVAVPTSTSASLAKPTGKDPALEQKRKQAEAEDAAKKKAEREQMAMAQAENCTR